ncbi:Dual specificity protein phosphatase 26 [Symbiodinium microadriaticum]|uniref:protein-serine/threonine phosphatase n=1 Tax=Symbiodinium microadriaticum TaxID=2951 RepID=A0A1Q9D6Z9_SYMMI|nr:Dual specificity protein phosphatase 26 [Symbiodinium microadriaticum]
MTEDTPRGYCFVRCWDEQTPVISEFVELKPLQQILANLLHRRPATSKTLGMELSEQGIAELLVKLHRWLQSQLVCALLPVPVNGLQADLVKMRESREAEKTNWFRCTPALDKEMQQMWVSLILDLMYAFPGLDGTLAQPCLQVLLRLCSVSVGAKAFLAYQQNPQSIAQSVRSRGCHLQLLVDLFAMVRLAFEGLPEGVRSGWPFILHVITSADLGELQPAPRLKRQISFEFVLPFPVHRKRGSVCESRSNVSQTQDRGYEGYLQMELVQGSGRLRGELTELASGGQADFLTLSYEGAGPFRVRVTAETGEEVTSEPVAVEATEDELAAQQALGDQFALEDVLHLIESILEQEGSTTLEAAEVNDWLLLGGKPAAELAAKANPQAVTHVLNCCEPWFVEGENSRNLSYSGIEAYDEPGYRLLDEHYATVIRPTLDSARGSGGRCLVHCAMGVNRSALVCAAYLIDAIGMDLLPALMLLKQTRGHVLGNRSFQLQLIEFAAKRDRLGKMENSSQQSCGYHARVLLIMWFKKDAQAEGGDGGVKALRLHGGPSSDTVSAQKLMQPLEGSFDWAGKFGGTRVESSPRLLQMLSDLVVMLLEEAPVLGQRMELEILGILGARKEVPARDIYQPLFPLMSTELSKGLPQGPVPRGLVPVEELQSHRIEAVARRSKMKDREAHKWLRGSSYMLAPIPEAERPRGPKKSLLPASALLVLQTLVNEICFGVDVQFRTTFPKLHEVASKTLEQAEDCHGLLDQEAPNSSSGSLPPAYPLALGPGLDALKFSLKGPQAFKGEEPPGPSGCAESP